MVVKVGYACGVCPKCGQEICRKKPADYAICDCWQYCPQGHKMEPYTPDLTPKTYRPVENTKAYGDLQHPMRIVMWCPICNYYSAQLSIEMTLT